MSKESNFSWTNKREGINVSSDLWGKVKTEVTHSRTGENKYEDESGCLVFTDHYT